MWYSMVGLQLARLEHAIHPLKYYIYILYSLSALGFCDIVTLNLFEIGTCNFKERRGGGGL